jgi:hexokinase
MKEEILNSQGFFDCSDADDTVTKALKILKDELGISYATMEDAELVRYVCSLISTRAAYLAGMGKLSNDVN